MEYGKYSFTSIVFYSLVSVTLFCVLATSQASADWGENEVEVNSVYEVGSGVVHVSKEITFTNRDVIAAKLNGEFGYCELEGKMLSVNLQVIHGDTRIRASMTYNQELDYPLMEINEVESLL